MRIFLGRREKKIACRNVSDDAYICMQIVLRALQARAESHSSPVFLELNHKLSVHYSWQETEANEGLMHSFTYAYPSLPVSVLVAVWKKNHSTENVQLNAHASVYLGLML